MVTTLFENWPKIHAIPRIPSTLISPTCSSRAGTVRASCRVSCCAREWHDPPCQQTHARAHTHTQWTWTKHSQASLLIQFSRVVLYIVVSLRASPSRRSSKLKGQPYELPDTLRCSELTVRRVVRSCLPTAASYLDSTHRMTGSILVDRQSRLGEHAYHVTAWVNIRMRIKTSMMKSFTPDFMIQCWLGCVLTGLLKIMCHLF